MKALVLAAGLGTRLRPWTEKHPKALVPVAGVPMLERVIKRLRTDGFDDIIINVHHFADQIVDFVENRDLGVKIRFSDETEELLDTGGALLKVCGMFAEDDEPFLVHNVDILSDASLSRIMEVHKRLAQDISLVTSPRESSRKLVFDRQGILKGWHKTGTDEYRPEGFRPDADCIERAFSGIYVVNPSAGDRLREYAEKSGTRKFPIMDFFMYNASLTDANPCKLKIGEITLPGLELIDIGKPDTLKRAEASKLLD